VNEDQQQAGDQTAETHPSRECMACRGSGKVISSLGGERSEVTCPWCEGRGMRVPGIDAQQHWGSTPANPAD